MVAVVVRITGKHILNVADNVSMQQLDGRRMVNYQVAARNSAEARAKAEERMAVHAKLRQDPTFGKEFFQQFGTSHR